MTPPADPPEAAPEAGRKRFYLLDGHAQIFRAYYAPFRELNAPDGRNVKAVYVFTQLLLNILHKERPEYLGVAFDVRDDTTFRQELFDDYKGHREKAPEDLDAQLGTVKDLLRRMGIATFEHEGFEADDVIATIAAKLERDDVDLYIVSKDKDLHQILSSQVLLWDPKDGERLSGDDLLEKMGYTAEQAVEVQTLTGDATDNIPGVPGIGTKTAAQLVRRYGSAKAVLEHADEQSPKRRENLLAAADVIDTSRQLVTLRRDAPVAFDLEACRTPAPTRESVEPIFRDLGFRTFLEAFEPEAPPEPGDPVARDTDGAEYRLVDDEADLEALVAALAERDAFAMDTETTSLRAVDADLIGLSFSWQAGEGVYVPVRCNDRDVLSPERVLEALRPVLEDERSCKVGQNLKYDLQVLACAGVEVKGPLFDTMIAAAILHPERRNNGMDALSRDLLGVTPIPISDLIGKGKNQTTLLAVPLDDLVRYAGEDADLTWRLYEHLHAELAEAPEVLRTLLDTLEFPLVRVLARMERHGVRLDLELLAQVTERLGARIEQLRVEIGNAAGRPFNPDSPQQLAEVLFDDLGMDVVKRTKTGRSTDASVLETLAGQSEHPLPRLVLEYRELTKLHGTYLAPLPTYVSPRTGRLHAGFHQTGAATGRLSSSDPNIQNIPVRTETGREIRRAFTASAPERELLTTDYSQVELRMLAHLSDDAEMRQAFEEGLDIHAYVASQIFGLPLEAVEPDQRRMAKTVNFGIVYGQTAWGLARTLRIPQGDAAAFIEAYKARYTGIDRFLGACIEHAREHGYVQTLLGRRRPVPEVVSRNRNLRSLGERLAINTVVQGSAADLIKLAMRNLDARIRDEGWDARMVIQVHDELVFDVHGEVVEAFTAVAREEMTGALELSVPLVVDAAHGANWLDGKP